MDRLHRRSRGGAVSAPVRSPMALDEGQRALPGVLGLRGEVLLAAVEERVRGARVGHDLVLGAGLAQRRLERLDLVGADRVVLAGHQRQQRRLDLARPLGRRRAAPLRTPGHPVEADGAREPVAVGGGQPRVAAAEAEADASTRSAPCAAQVRDRGGDVGPDALRRRLRDVLGVLEVVAALVGARRAAEVVDRDAPRWPRSAKRSASSS